MSEVENTTPEPDASDLWFEERQARLSEAYQRIEAQKSAVSGAYSSVEAKWQQLEERESIAHDELDTRALVSIQQEKARLQFEAQQLQNGWSALQDEEQKVSRFYHMDYNGLLETSSEPSQMMLRAYRSKLESDPSALRKLQFEHSRAVAKNIKPDSREYFQHLEDAMGWDGTDRKTDDFFQNEPKQARSAKPKEGKLTVDQLEMAKNLHGISEKEYLDAVIKSQSYDPNDTSHVYLDPGEMVDSSNEPAMEYKVVAEPKSEKKYRPPNSKTSVKLSKEEVDLCRDSGISPTDYAKNKIYLRDGRTNHQLYVDKVKSSMGARYR